MRIVASKTVLTPEDLISAVQELTAGLNSSQVFMTLGADCLFQVVLRETSLKNMTLYNLSLEPAPSRPALEDQER